MWVAPLGAFGSIAFTVGKFGTSSLLQLGALILEFYVVSLVFVFVVLGGVAWWAGVSLLRLLRYIREEIVIVAATTSTETVLPRLMQRLRELGCEESVVGLVIPTGYSFNLDGTCLYLATVVVFLAQATNTPLDLTHQLIVLAVLLLASKGAAGVAGAAFVVLAATLGCTRHCASREHRARARHPSADGRSAHVREPRREFRRYHRGVAMGRGAGCSGVE